MPQHTESYLDNPVPDSSVNQVQPDKIKRYSRRAFFAVTGISAVALIADVGKNFDTPSDCLVIPKKKQPLPFGKWLTCTARSPLVRINTAVLLAIATAGVAGSEK